MTRLSFRSMSIGVGGLFALSGRTAPPLPTVPRLARRPISRTSRAAGALAVLMVLAITGTAGNAVCDDRARPRRRDRISNAFRQARYLAIAPLAALVLTACLGGGGLDRAEPEAAMVDPARLVLSLSDVPEGFAVELRGYTDNRTAAESFPDPDAWLKKLDQWGRESGYEIHFASENQLLNTGAFLFQSIEGASKAFEEERLQLRSIFEAGLDPHIRVDSFDFLEEPRVGDASYLVRAQASSGSLEAETFAVGFRAGNINAVVVLVDQSDRITQGDVIRLARRQLEIIEDAILQGSTGNPSRR